MADINSDVIIKFWIEKNKDGKIEKIDLGKDTIYLGSFETKTKTTKLNLPYIIENGDYDLYVESGYENYKASSFRKINIQIPEEVKYEVELAAQSPGFILYLFLGILLGIGAVGILFYINKHKEFFYFHFRHKIIPHIILIRKTRYLNGNVRIKSLGGKRVYSEAGDFLGRIDKAILEKNKIHSWIMIPNKKLRLSRDVKIMHSYVKDINKIFIVNDKVEDYLEYLGNKKEENKLNEFFQKFKEAINRLEKIIDNLISKLKQKMNPQNKTPNIKTYYKTVWDGREDEG